MIIELGGGQFALIPVFVASSGQEYDSTNNLLIQYLLSVKSHIFVCKREEVRIYRPTSDSLCDVFLHFDWP